MVYGINLFNIMRFNFRQRLMHMLYCILINWVMNFKYFCFISKMFLSVRSKWQFLYLPNNKFLIIWCLCSCLCLYLTNTSQAYSMWGLISVLHNIIISIVLKKCPIRLLYGSTVRNIFVKFLLVNRYAPPAYVFSNSYA